MTGRARKLMIGAAAAALVGGAFAISTGVSSAGENCGGLDQALQNNLNFIQGQKDNPDAQSQARIANRQAVVDLIQQRRAAAGCTANVAANNGNAGNGNAGNGNAGNGGNNGQGKGSGEDCGGLDKALQNNLNFIAGQKANPDAQSQARIANRQAVVDLIQKRRAAAGCTGNVGAGNGNAGQGNNGNAGQGNNGNAGQGNNGNAGQGNNGNAGQGNNGNAGQGNNGNAGQGNNGNAGQGNNGNAGQGNNGNAGQGNNGNAGQGNNGNAGNGTGAGEVVCKGQQVTTTGSGGRTALSGTFPVGTKLKVTNLDNNKSIEVEVEGPSGSCVLLNNVAFNEIHEEGKLLIRRAVIERVG
ncbi:hypothetical protein [Krasilnikovia sp. MM14-A1004]|uniref:hypothetical protein n=1 Tax=Krasilnikovia sp. MM14-A1004 TaxID=3373541 RepID=UPI00399C60B6